MTTGSALTGSTLTGSTLTGRIGLVAVLALTLAGCSDTEVSRFPSPDKKSAIVVRQYSQAVDPMYPIVLERDGRSREIGCVNGDYSGVQSVRWLDDRTVQLSFLPAEELAAEVVVVVGEQIVETPKNSLLHSCV